MQCLQRRHIGGKYLVNKYFAIQHEIYIMFPFDETITSW